MANFTPFSFTKYLIKEKSVKWEDFDESQHKMWSSFLINRNLSMSDVLLEISNLVNPYLGVIPNNLLYMFYQNVISSNHSTYIPYLKKKEINLVNKNLTPQLLQFLGEKLELGTNEIKDVLKDIDGLELEKYLHNYGLKLKDFK